jgi:hypothetical protein
MGNSPLTGAGPAAIDLNQPSTYLHWNVFTVSVANLVLIAVMVVIFAVALLLPFPRPQDIRDGDASQAPDEAAENPAYAALPGDERMWTARVRRRVMSALPPNKVLPDRQPAYVASWVYVFGVASLAALGVAIASGFAIALGGPDWWHTDPVGHFFNSLHLWSVELFMALLVIHLWGKFWMAAWRGKRTLTWITGVVAFLASIVECFTGYLSQQNFDSQWIATNGKDAFNAVGVGAFFNLMNFGQMLLWHVLLIPIVLVAIVGAHVLLVRIRGVSPPLPARRTRGLAARREARKADRAAWRGPTRRYDILKEGTIATLVILLLTFGLAGLLSSPDVPPVTVASWAKAAPADFLGTAASELNGTSLTATYGPPYNTNGAPQSILFAPANWFGVTMPITDTAQTFVLGPLAQAAPINPAVKAALAVYNAAPASLRNTWATNYGKAVTNVKFVNGVPVVPKANDGPVPVMLAAELALAQSGSIDTDLLAQRQFYGTDFTKPLLFLNDGMYYSNLAASMNLTGSQWGVMNETGSYPGQPWLWLYQLWYQLPGFRTSPNADLIAIYLTGAATLLLLLIPFIPGLRDIPRWIPIHRLIWPSNYSAGRPFSGIQKVSSLPLGNGARKAARSTTRARRIQKALVFAFVVLSILTTLAISIYIVSVKHEQEAAARVTASAAVGTYVLALVASLVAIAAYRLSVRTPRLSLELTFPGGRPGELVLVREDKEESGFFALYSIPTVRKKELKLRLHNISAHPATTLSVRLTFTGLVGPEKVRGWARVVSPDQASTADFMWALQWRAGDRSLEGGWFEDLPSIDLTNVRVSARDEVKLVKDVIAEGYREVSNELQIRTMSFAEWRQLSADRLGLASRTGSL